MSYKTKLERHREDQDGVVMSASQSYRAGASIIFMEYFLLVGFCVLHSQRVRDWIYYAVAGTFVLSATNHIVSWHLRSGTARLPITLLLI